MKVDELISKYVHIFYAGGNHKRVNGRHVLCLNVHITYLQTAKKLFHHEKTKLVVIFLLLQNKSMLLRTILR